MKAWAAQSWCDFCLEELWWSMIQSKEDLLFKAAARIIAIDFRLWHVNRYRGIIFGSIYQTRVQTQGTSRQGVWKSFAKHTLDQGHWDVVEACDKLPHRNGNVRVPSKSCPVPVLHFCTYLHQERQRTYPSHRRLRWGNALPGESAVDINVGIAGLSMLEQDGCDLWLFVDKHMKPRKILINSISARNPLMSSYFSSQLFSQDPESPAMAPSAECAVLEFEVQNLREELRSYDQQLPCWSAELAAAEAYAEELEDEAKAEKHAREAKSSKSSKELRTRKIRALSPASSEGERDHLAALEHDARMGLHGFHFEDPLIPFAGLSDEELHNRHLESKMHTEISRREVAIAHLKRRHLYTANENIASMKQERSVRVGAMWVTTEEEKERIGDWWCDDWCFSWDGWVWS